LEKYIADQTDARKSGLIYNRHTHVPMTFGAHDDDAGRVVHNIFRRKQNVTEEFVLGTRLAAASKFAGANHFCAMYY
jgi:hypothetical protein